MKMEILRIGNIIDREVIGVQIGEVVLSLDEIIPIKKQLHLRMVLAELLEKYAHGEDVTEVLCEEVKIPKPDLVILKSEDMTTQDILDKLVEIVAVTDPVSAQSLSEALLRDPF